METNSAFQFLKSSVISLAIAALALSSGCVSMDADSVVLSEKIGERISQGEQLHREALRQKFDADRRALEQFFSDKWVPLFLKNFLGLSGVINDLNTTSRIESASREQIREALKGYLDEDEVDNVTRVLTEIIDKNRRGELSLIKNALKDQNPSAEIAEHVYALLGTTDQANIMTDFVLDAQTQINQARRELFAPIDQQQAQLEAAIIDFYSDTRRGMAILNGRLAASARASSNQDQFIGSLLGAEGKTDEIRSKGAALSVRVENAINSATEAIDELDRSPIGDQKTIAQILDSIKSAIAEPIVK